MRKIIAIALAVLVSFPLVPSAFAQKFNINPPGQALNTAQAPIENIPQFLVTLLFIIGIVIALAFLIYGGIKWILSGGDSKQVESARNHIVAAIVGLLIVVGAFVILNIVFRIVTGQEFNFGNLCIPSLSNPTCSGPKSKLCPSGIPGSPPVPC